MRERSVLAVFVSAAALAACSSSGPSGATAAVDASASPDARIADGRFLASPDGGAAASAELRDASAGSPPAEAGPPLAPDAGSDAAIASFDWPPDGGIFLDGACPYDADWSSDAAAPIDAPDARVPSNHRPAGLCCPLARPAGETCDPDASLPPAACFTDSDCTEGTNGRCLVVPDLIPPPGFPDVPTPAQFTLGCSSYCTYDECFSDSDCPGHVPCDCRTYDYGNNTCAIGSNCRVDSDCGPGGYCTESGAAYYCHRPGDVCFANADCPQGHWGASCVFETSTNQWACVDAAPPPD